MERFAVLEKEKEMNQVLLTGRIVNDLELKKVGSDISLLGITIAVDRRYKDKAGEKITDFFNLTVWRQGAEYIANYGNKGDLIAVSGTLQNRTYEKDGENRRITEIQAEQVEILQGKKRTEEPQEELDKTEDLITGEDLPF
jgi:single-strand DNA-binding protein